ncbi:SpoIIE family protein phosphatase [Streptomyces sp. 2323.1]|uniref:SpoIIE family protein phosphatase n=1 Tax=Streptomyces sp. 2323.1 TaxID=1938841 RepID=UPI003FA739AE
MVSLPPGATLISCSDGVTEARNSTGTFYPLEERLRTWADISPWELAGNRPSGVGGLSGTGRSRAVRGCLPLLRVTPQGAECPTQEEARHGTQEDGERPPRLRGSGAGRRRQGAGRQDLAPGNDQGEGPP